MGNTTKKITIYGEINYVLSLVLITLAVAMLASAGYGLSFVVAPAYILSEYFPWLSFGTAGYIVYGIQFIIMCIALRKVKPLLLVSFLTVVIYGLMLDAWCLIPIFNQSVTPPESLPTVTRIIFFVVGLTLTCFSIALSFQTYIYPQVYDFFVSTLTKHFKVKLSIFKTAVDVSFLAISVIMSFIFFKTLVGVHFGTLIMTFTSGFLVSFFSKLLSKYLYSPPLFPKLAYILDKQIMEI